MKSHCHSNPLKKDRHPALTCCTEQNFVVGTIRVPQLKIHSELSLVPLVSSPSMRVETQVYKLDASD
jgi:hypothetical protein